MAELAQKGGKIVPRVDMTPLVDTAFLLLTFFVLTTSVKQDNPLAMKMVLPPKVEEEDKDQIDPPEIPQSKILNLLVGGDDKIYYYQAAGDAKAGDVELNQTDYSRNGLNKVVYKYQRMVKEKFPPPKNELNVVIKMTDEAVYKNFVQVIDEMKITRNDKFILDTLTTKEREMIAAYEGGEIPAGE